MRDWRDLALTCAIEAGALRACEHHQEVTLVVRDQEADAQTNGWLILVAEAAKQGFTEDPDRWLQPDYIYILQMAEETCPQCGSD